MPQSVQPAAFEPLESRRLFAAAPIGGIGVIGDSLSDEYQFYPPDRSTARNFVEQLAEDRGLNFGAFDATVRDDARGADGFAYNWARDGATTADIVGEGQHTGLAAQAAAGEANYAWVFAGGNDLLSLADAEDPAGAVLGLADALLANGQAILGALLGAKPDMRVVVATVPKLGHLPVVRELATNGTIPQSLIDSADTAIDQVNVQLRQLGKAEKQIAVADVAGLMDQLFAKKRYKVGRVVLDRETASNAAQSLFLADGVHAGTLGQGLLANVFVKAMKKEFKAKIKPLSAKEILANAGLQPNGQPIVPAAAPTVSGDVLDRVI